MAFMTCIDPADIENGDAVVFDAGRLDIYNKIDGKRSSTPTTPLMKYKAGYVPVNAWTELPGYWQETPKVLVSLKKGPTYYARGILGQQRFTLSCAVQSAGTALKYQIKPTLTFYIGSGSSGTVTVNETAAYGSEDWYASQSSMTFADKCTTPQYGAGTLSVNISWQTMASNADYYHWTTACQIYIDKFMVSSSGAITTESEQLVSESGVAYGQAAQTETFSGIDLGSGTCSWVIRKAVQTGAGSSASSGRDIVNLLRLNSYSYTTSAETLAPSGEAFYLAIGR